MERGGRSDHRINREDPAQPQGHRGHHLRPAHHDLLRRQSPHQVGLLPAAMLRHPGSPHALRHRQMRALQPGREASLRGRPGILHGGGGGYAGKLLVVRSHRIKIKHPPRQNIRREDVFVYGSQLLRVWPFVEDKHINWDKVN